MDTIALADHERWATVNNLGTRVILTNHAANRIALKSTRSAVGAHVYGKFEGLNNRGDTLTRTDHARDTLVLSDAMATCPAQLSARHAGVRCLWAMVRRLLSP